LNRLGVACILYSYRDFGTIIISPGGVDNSCK
jgi:hypothetical protein